MITTHSPPDVSFVVEKHTYTMTSLTKKQRRMQEEAALDEAHAMKQTTPPAYYITIAAMTACLPAILFLTIFVLELSILNIAVLAVGAVIATVALKIGYENVSAINKPIFAQQRANGVRACIEGEVKGKKMATSDIDLLVAKREQMVCESEACHYSLAFNNGVFLVALVVCSFYLFRNMNDLYNYAASTIVAAVAVFFMSTSQA
eukprot:m.352635 g.352635  ORF g.352635 m.352635 type:complete len:204 (-) comp16572_c0_seq1:242-853(-)